MGQRKNLSPRQDLNLRPSVHQSDALTTDLWRTRGELGHIQGTSMTRVLHTARKSNVQIVMSVIYKELKMVNSRLGEEMKNDVFNVSRARDKEKI